MSELKPCDTRCIKCGSNDKHLVYRKEGEAIKNYNYYDKLYTNNYYVTKEHLHHVCRKCCYEWDTEPLNTRSTDPLLKEMAEALERCIKSIECSATHYQNSLWVSKYKAEQALQKYKETTCQQDAH